MKKCDTCGLEHEQSECPVRAEAAKPEEAPESGFKSFTKKYAELWKFIKFSLAGGSATIIEFIVYYALALWLLKPMNTGAVSLWIFEYEEGAGTMWAFLISTTIGYALAFVLNRKITFHADSNPVVSTIIYVIMVIFTIIATTWIGMYFTSLFADRGWATAADLLPKPIAALLATGWTYPLNRFVIHKKKKQD